LLISRKDRTNRDFIWFFIWTPSWKEWNLIWCAKLPLLGSLGNTVSKMQVIKTFCIHLTTHFKYASYLILAMCFMFVFNHDFRFRSAYSECYFLKLRLRFRFLSARRVANLLALNAELHHLNIEIKITKAHNNIRNQ